MLLDLITLVLYLVSFAIVWWCSSSSSTSFFLLLTGLTLLLFLVLLQPAVYVAESAISSGTAGSSSDGAKNTAAIVGGLPLSQSLRLPLYSSKSGKTPLLDQKQWIIVDRLLATTLTSSSLQKLFKLLPLPSRKLHLMLLSKKPHCRKTWPVRLNMRRRLLFLQPKGLA